jgi:hypothetical protein
MNDLCKELTRINMTGGPATAAEYALAVNAPGLEWPDRIPHYPRVSRIFLVDPADLVPPTDLGTCHCPANACQNPLFPMDRSDYCDFCAPYDCACRCMCVCDCDDSGGLSVQPTPDDYL